MNEDNTSNSAASSTAKTITVEATTGEAMHELGKHVAHLAHGGDVILLSGPLGAGKPPSPKVSAQDSTSANPSSRQPSPSHANSKANSPTATPPTSYTSTPTDSAATPTPQAKTPSNTYLTNSNPSDSTKNSKIPATTPSSSWNGANRWLPRSHRNASKSTSTGRSTPPAQAQRPIRPAANSPATAYVP